MSVEGFHIKCATCGGAITRDAQVKRGDEWVHMDDEVTMTGTGRVRSVSNYDHLASPDVIDLEKKSQQLLVSGEQTRYVDTRPIEAVSTEVTSDSMDHHSNTHNTDNTHT